MTDERKDQLTAEADGLIEGRNAVIEALRTEASISCLPQSFVPNSKHILQREQD